MDKRIALTKADFSCRRNDEADAFKSMKSSVDGNAIDRVITWFRGVGCHSDHREESEWIRKKPEFFGSY